MNEWTFFFTSIKTHPRWSDQKHNYTNIHINKWKLHTRHNLLKGSIEAILLVIEPIYQSMLFIYVLSRHLNIFIWMTGPFTWLWRACPVPVKAPMTLRVSCDTKILLFIKENWSAVSHVVMPPGHLQEEYCQCNMETYYKAVQIIGPVWLSVYPYHSSRLSRPQRVHY